MALGANYLKGAVVAPGQVFSLNARLGRRTSARGFRPGPEYSGDRLATTVGGGVCKIATVLYNAVVLAALPVVERHTHSMTVPYVPPGQDATIDWGHKDFRFRNDTGSPILIWARNTGPTLYVGLYGKAKPPKVAWEHRVLQRTPYKTSYQRDKALPPGRRKVLQPGADGVVVHSWLVTTYPDGRTVRRDLGVSRYRPEPRIIATGG
ncbi:MAG: VanW family protein [Chitinophagales bacterium]